LNLPAPRNPLESSGIVQYEPQVDDADLRVGQIVAMLRRSKWLILACAAIAYAATFLYLRKADRVYEASVSLQIEEKQSNVPDMLRAFAPTTDVSTDLEVVGSRTLIEEATRLLALQVRLIYPGDVSRERVFSDIQVAPGAKRMEYAFVRQDDSSFAVADQSGTQLGRVRPGGRVVLQGTSLRLTPAASQYSELRVMIRSFADAVARTSVTVSRAGKEADIIRVSYEDTDRGLVWRVPNAIAESFIQRRQDAQKVATRSQAKFLREQLDTLSVQLAAAESDLKSFRERARVVDPTVEASGQINRLISLQADRSSLEAERSALASLLKDVEERHKRQSPGKPSVYRDLLAFPSLLRSQAASQLLGSLAQVEDQRSTLLTRRTEADPDVQLLTSRIHELENQLSSIATSYLQGLTSQIASMDATIAQFGGELGKMPRKELEYARLERKPEVLKEMYSLLQTRLKEAEIAEAAVNNSVSIVDPAIPPRKPIRPKPGLLTMMGVFGGLLAGIGLAMAREYADRSIKTRSQATAASGLPVMAIIPRIARQSHRSAIIAKRSTAAIPKATGNSHRPTPPAPQTGGYTFFSGAPSPGTPADSPPGSPAAAPVIARHPPARMTLSRAAGAVAEAYAILQTNISFSRPQEHIKVLALTSALPGEGKTTTAVNLALTLCQRGLSVCLIDADLRRPQLHDVFHVAREPGLSEVLRGLQTFEGAYRPVHIGDGYELAVLTAGAPVASAPALVGSGRMRTLLGELRERFDLVILDTPPVNILTDAALLGVNADGVLVVVRAGATDSTALQYAMEQLNHVRAPSLGVVLNDIDLKRFGAYDGAYRYYAYSAYTDANSKQS
jgi:capsular exopolysaccharide synthesis family protein